MNIVLSMATLLTTLLAAMMATVPFTGATPPQKRDTIATACRELTLLDSTTLQAVCTTAPGQGEDISAIDLDNCVGNNNGDLAM